MDFNAALSEALAQNGGTISLQQATDLLPNSAKHKVMTHLNAASRAGIVDLRVKRVGEELIVLITNPVPEGGA